MCRRGISPILSTLLLIVVAFAAVAITYSWILTSGSSIDAKSDFKPQMADVSFNSTGIYIEVQNAGKNPGELTALYIGSNYSNLNKTATTQTFPISIGPGQIQTLTVPTVNYAWTNGNTYYFKIVRSDGVAVIFNVQP